jgi:hypothetical protein
LGQAETNAAAPDRSIGSRGAWGLPAKPLHEKSSLLRTQAIALDFTHRMNNLPARSSKITKRILVCYDAPGFQESTRVRPRHSPERVPEAQEPFVRVKNLCQSEDKIVFQNTGPSLQNASCDVRVLHPVCIQ